MRTTLALMVTLVLAAPVAFIGCDRTVSETSHTSSTPGGTVHQETKKVTTDDGGNTRVTQEKETVVNH